MLYRIRLPGTGVFLVLQYLFKPLFDVLFPVLDECAEIFEFERDSFINIEVIFRVLIVPCFKVGTAFALVVSGWQELEVQYSVIMF